MTKETYVKGMLLFVATFQKMKIDDNTQDAWFMLLEDLGDDQFLRAIKKVCQAQPEFYPGTNFVALVRKLALGLSPCLVECECNWVFNIGEYQQMECPRCGSLYTKGEGSQKDYLTGRTKGRLPSAIGADNYLLAEGEDNVKPS